MKVLTVNENDIECCHDTLKESLVDKFIKGNYTYIEIKDNSIDENTIYKTEVLIRIDGKFLVFITEPVVLG